MLIQTTIPTSLPPKPPGEDRAQNPLWEKAQALEATFLSEMLGHASVGDSSASLGGGIGEDQFASFLRQEQATAIVKHGGLGLAESLFRALTEKSDAKP